MALKFQSFEIENHDNCVYDFLGRAEFKIMICGVLMLGWEGANPELNSKKVEFK